MSESAFPSPNVPIFNPLYWGGSGGTGNYVNYPTAQGAINTVGITNQSTFLNYGGTQLQSQLIVSGLVSTYSSIVMNTVGNYLQFPDGTRQVTSATSTLLPIVPSPAGNFNAPTNVTVNDYGQVTTIQNITESVTAGTFPAPVVTVNEYGQITAITNVDETVTAGSYTNTNVTVNEYGQITAISNGTGVASINQYVQAPSYIANPLSTGTFYPITIPAGTRTATITLVSGGGLQGADYLNGDTMFSGGTGGGGSFQQLSINITNFDFGFNLLEYGFNSVAQPPNIPLETNGWGATLRWSASAQAYFGAPCVSPTNLGNGIITYLTAGGTGGDANSVSSGQGGTGGLITAPSLPSQFIMNDSGGSQGTSSNFQYSTASNLKLNSGLNALASMRANGAIVGGWAVGQTSIYNASTTNKLYPGNGGIILEFFS